MGWRLHNSFTVSAIDKYCTALNLYGNIHWKIEWEKLGVGEDRFIATIYLNLDQRYVFDSFNEYRTSGYKEYYPDISPYDNLCLKVHDGTWLIKIYIWDLVPY